MMRVILIMIPTLQNMYHVLWFIAKTVDRMTIGVKCAGTCHCKALKERSNNVSKTTKGNLENAVA